MPKVPQGRQRPADVIGKAVQIAGIATAEYYQVTCRQSAKLGLQASLNIAVAEIRKVVVSRSAAAQCC